MYLPMNARDYTSIIYSSCKFLKNKKDSFRDYEQGTLFVRTGVAEM